eukprot:TRINITY_DN10692_c0_g1_i1.p1 TRINITY_DN10692_c0_g1~~TRINITY_DN10692_c0_g1_i1.p1  ORF type:complete len:248 (+),score=16.97 TRINITY_DN10692_c0_g1_i1:57-800(+)
MYRTIRIIQGIIGFCIFTIFCLLVLINISSIGEKSMKNCYIVNTYSGDVDLLETHCARYEHVYGCSNDHFISKVCPHIFVHGYEYGYFSYKKLQCMEQVMNLEPDCNIVLIDSDTFVFDYHKVYHDLIYCYHTVMGIFHEPWDTYYVFNESLTDGLYCGGGYMFIPNKFLKKMWSELFMFEHYKADDVAFTNFFNALNLPITDEVHNHVDGGNNCVPVGDNLRLQCRKNEIMDRSYAAPNTSWYRIF